MKTYLVIMGAVAAVVGACNTEPAIVRTARKVEIVHVLENALLKSVEAEKSAVLATTDEDSQSSAVEARRFTAEINRHRRDLRRLITTDDDPAELARLDAFDAAWRDFEDVDRRLLALAVANTNLKATRLAVSDGAKVLARFVDALVEMQNGSADPELIRAALAASVSALRVQSLLMAHIPSPDDAEMGALEKRIEGLGGETGRQLEVAGRMAASRSPEKIADARRAWDEYRRIVAEVLRLSRQNTNVLSFDVSVHEKRRVTRDCLSALAALLKTIESVQTGTR